MINKIKNMCVFKIYFSSCPTRTSVIPHVFVVESLRYDFWNILNHFIFEKCDSVNIRYWWLKKLFWVNYKLDILEKNKIYALNMFNWYQLKKYLYQNDTYQKRYIPKPYLHNVDYQQNDTYLLRWISYS